MFRRRRRFRSRFALTQPLTPNPNSRAWRTSEIQKLCNTTRYFETVFLAPESPFISTIARLSEVLGYTDEAIKTTDAFKHAFGERLCQTFYAETAEKFKHQWGYTRLHNADYLSFISQAAPYLLDKYKEGLLTSFLSNWKNFNPAGKKIMGGLASDFVPAQDSRTIDILRIFLRNLTVEDISSLIQKIPQGLENPSVKQIIKHTKTLEYLTFDAQAFANDPKERERIVKAIGKTPSLSKRLPFKMVFTLADLKTIAPAMRFDFVQYALQYEIKYARWGYTGDNLIRRAQYRKERMRATNLEIELITAEQMKELLFSVCLKKHAEFSTWMEFYTKYVTAVTSPESQTQY